MADPPPRDPSSDLSSVADSPQPDFAVLPQPTSSDLPDSSIATPLSGHLQSGMPNSGLGGDFSVHPQPSESVCRPPLAELNFNGGAAGAHLPIGNVVFSAKAVTKKPSSARPPVALSHRKLKKMKTAASKPLSDQPPPVGELLQQKAKNSKLDARDCIPSEAGTPAVVAPLQTITAEDVSLGDGEDVALSDSEEDEEDFD